MGFEDIYSLYKQDVFCYLCGLTGNADEAEELLAETFFRDAAVELVRLQLPECVIHYNLDEYSSAKPLR